MIRWILPLLIALLAGASVEETLLEGGQIGPHSGGQISSDG